MKFVGSRTLRGQVELPGSESPFWIRLFDGEFSTAYKITEFHIGPVDVSDAATTLGMWSAKIATSPDLDQGAWNWSDNREIAWAQASFDANTNASITERSIVDKDNLIVTDIWLYGNEYNEAAMNYLITIEKWDVSLTEGLASVARGLAVDGST